MKGTLANSFDPDQTRRLIRVYTVCVKFKIISTHNDNKNQSGHPDIGNGPAQKVKVEELTRLKWVKKQKSQ